MRHYATVPSDELAYESRFDVAVNRSAEELAERVYYYMENADAVEHIVACDYDLVFGLLKAIYNAGELDKPESMIMYSKALHRFMRDTAESIVKAS